MAEDKILHFADHHDETAAAISLPSHVRAYRDYLEHFHQAEQDADLPELPDEFPEAKAVARVNQGRWLWRCVGCNSATLLDADEEYSICPRCGFNGWMEVDWPDNKSEIEAELLKMTGDGLGKRLAATVREWRPGWTLEYLEERTKKALELSKKGGRVRALSIGARRIWTVGEILTADHMNTYLSDIQDDLAGANGIIELETDPVNNVGGLRPPVLTTAQRTAMTAIEGTVVWDSDLSRQMAYEDGAWVSRAQMSDHDLTAGDILYADANGRVAAVGVGASGQVLASGGTSASPGWQDRGLTIADVFTDSGTWTKTAGAKVVYVQMWGGGGNGAVAGGGGGYNEGWFLADDLGATETVTVGTAAANSSFAGLTAGGGTSSTNTVARSGGDRMGFPLSSPSSGVNHFRGGAGATGVSGSGIGSIYGGGGGSTGPGDGGHTGWGGGGGSGNPATTHGTSIYGGDGGGPDEDGTAPGGGGGGGTTPGSGARGEVRVYTF